MTFYVIRVILNWIISAYIAILFARMILDWVRVLTRWTPRGFVYSLVDAVYTVTEPPLRWLRRYIPSLNMGPIAFDLSFMILYFVLVVLQSII